MDIAGHRHGPRKRQHADRADARRRHRPVAPVTLHDSVGDREERGAEMPEGPEPGRRVGPVPDDPSLDQHVRERQQLKKDNERHVEAARAEHEQRHRTRAAVLGEEQVGGQRVHHDERRLVHRHEARHRRHRLADDRQEPERDRAEDEAHEAGEQSLRPAGLRRREGCEHGLPVDHEHRPFHDGACCLGGSGKPLAKLKVSMVLEAAPRAGGAPRARGPDRSGAAPDEGTRT